MSGHDFYNQPVSQPVTQAYYNYGPDPDLRQDTSYPSAPPSYTSRPPARGTSPFEAPFDDHVYPARPYEHSPDSQQSFASTTYAQGGGGRPQDSNSQFRDDIPLRSTNAKRVETPTDHVYDAPEAGFMPTKKADPRARGFGYFRKGKIPWVVYTLTIIQIAVFIAELVKCGKSGIL